jgi:predicted XRE-type DNA-binding protein
MIEAERPVFWRKLSGCTGEGRIDKAMKTTRRTQSKRIRIQKSSGNVFADLGLPHPEQELLKARLTLQIYRLLKQRGLKQTDAGKILGIQQPHVSALMQPLGYLFGRTPHGVSYCSWAGCGDYREARAQAAGRDVGRGMSDGSWNPTFGKERQRWATRRGRSVPTGRPNRARCRFFGAEAPFIAPNLWRGAEAPLFHGAAG